MAKRRNFTDQFKAKVALEALRGDETVQEIAAKHQLHRDLPPAAPSVIARVCGSGFHMLRFRFGQARRARSPHLAQSSGALLRAFDFRAMSAA